MEKSRLRFLPGALVALVAATVYIRTLGFGFVFDDRHLIVDSTFVREPWSVLRAFAHHFWYGTHYGPGYYRPLVVSSLALNGRLLGWGPAGFHLVNVLLHATNAVLLLILGRRLGIGDRRAALGATLFALHPAASWTVASIVARVDLLAAFFVLLAWIACASPGAWDAGPSGSRWRNAALSGAFFLCALLCKESAASFLLVPLLGQGAGSRRPRALAAALAAFGIYLALRVGAGAGILLGPEGIDPAMNPLAHLPLPGRVVAALALTGHYLFYLLAPLGIFRDPFGYSGEPAPSASQIAWATASLGLILIWSLGALALWLRRQRAATPLAFALGSFLPASNLLLPIASLYALNFLYMPLAGLCLGAAATAERLELSATRPQRENPDAAPAPRRSPWTIRAAETLVPLLAAGLACLSMREAAIWRDDLSLFTSWVGRFPLYTTAWSHLGAVLLEHGDPTGALSPLRNAVALDRRSAEAHFDLGSALVRTVADPERGKADLEEALEETRAALHLSPGLFQARVNESKILLMLGKPSEAEDAARAALATSPGYPPALENLGAALFKQRRYAEAARSFGEEARIFPKDRSARAHRILALVEAGALEDARRESLAAREAFPEDARFDFCLARVEVRAGTEAKVLALLKSALAKDRRAASWIADDPDLRRIMVP